LCDIALCDIALFDIAKIKIKSLPLRKYPFLAVEIPAWVLSKKLEASLAVIKWFVQYPVIANSK
jgi:hypothetical protein